MDEKEERANESKDATEDEDSAENIPDETEEQTSVDGTQGTTEDELEEEKGRATEYKDDASEGSPNKSSKVKGSLDGRDESTSEPNATDKEEKSGERKVATEDEDFTTDIPKSSERKDAAADEDCTENIPDETVEQTSVDGTPIVAKGESEHGDDTSEESPNKSTVVKGSLDGRDETTSEQNDTDENEKPSEIKDATEDEDFTTNIPKSSKRNDNAADEDCTENIPDKTVEQTSVDGAQRAVDEDITSEGELNETENDENVDKDENDTETPEEHGMDLEEKKEVEEGRNRSSSPAGDDGDGQMQVISDDDDGDPGELEARDDNDEREANRDTLEADHQVTSKQQSEQEDEAETKESSSGSDDDGSGDDNTHQKTSDSLTAKVVEIEDKTKDNKSVSEKESSSFESDDDDDTRQETSGSAAKKVAEIDTTKDEKSDSENESSPSGSDDDSHQKTSGSKTKKVTEIDDLTKDEKSDAENESSPAGSDDEDDETHQETSSATKKGTEIDDMTKGEKSDSENEMPPSGSDDEDDVAPDEAHQETSSATKKVPEIDDKTKDDKSDSENESSPSGSDDEDDDTHQEASDLEIKKGTEIDDKTKDDKSDSENESSPSGSDDDDDDSHQETKGSATKKVPGMEDKMDDKEESKSQSQTESKNADKRDQTIDKESESESWYCQLCDRYFATKAHLDRHNELGRHFCKNVNGVYNCRFCKQVFGSIGGVIFHESICPKKKKIPAASSEADKMQDVAKTKSSKAASKKTPVKSVGKASKQQSPRVDKPAKAKSSKAALKKTPVKSAGKASKRQSPRVDKKEEVDEAKSSKAVPKKTPVKSPGRASKRLSPRVGKKEDVDEAKSSKSVSKEPLVKKPPYKKLYNCKYCNQEFLSIGEVIFHDTKCPEKKELPAASSGVDKQQDTSIAKTTKPGSKSDETLSKQQLINEKKEKIVSSTDGRRLSKFKEQDQVDTSGIETGKVVLCQFCGVGFAVANIQKHEEKCVEVYCKICKKASRNASMYKDHVKEGLHINQNGMYQCEVCKAEFEFVSRLKLHWTRAKDECHSSLEKLAAERKKIDGSKGQVTETASKKKTEGQNLHRTRAKGASHFSLEKLAAETKKIAGSKGQNTAVAPETKSQSQHAIILKYQCKICNRDFEFQSYLKRHRDRTKGKCQASPEKPIPVKAKKSVVPNEESTGMVSKKSTIPQGQNVADSFYAEHLNEKTGFYQCKVCFAQYQYKSKLKRHWVNSKGRCLSSDKLALLETKKLDGSKEQSGEMASVKKTIPEGQTVADEGTDNFCKTCSRSFSNRRLFEKHMTAGLHKNLKGMYACDACGAECQLVSLLQSHRLEHKDLQTPQQHQNWHASPKKMEERVFDEKKDIINVVKSTGQKETRNKEVSAPGQPTTRRKRKVEDATSPSPKESQHKRTKSAIDSRGTSKHSPGAAFMDTVTHGIRSGSSSPAPSERRSSFGSVDGRTTSPMSPMGGTLYCKFCNLVFRSDGAIEKHVNSCQPFKKTVRIGCKACKKDLKNVEAAKAHRGRCTKSMEPVKTTPRRSDLPNYCNQCRRTYEDIDTHRRVGVHRNANGKFECKFCKKEFDEANMMLNHKRSDCALAKEAAQAKTTLALAKTKYCQKCDRTFATVIACQTHVAAGRHKNDQGVYVCEQCGKDFQYEKGLISHERIDHPKEGDKDLVAELKHGYGLDSDQTPGDNASGANRKVGSTPHSQKKKAELLPLYHCDHCGDVFTSETNLQKHGTVCGGSGDYRENCRFCEGTFFDRKLLEEHESKYCTNREVVVIGGSLKSQKNSAKSGKTADESQSARATIRVENDSKDKLADDVDTDGGTSKTWSCLQCHTTYSQQVAYEKHMLGPHKNKDGLYACEICKTTFQHVRTLYRHKRNFHANQKEHKAKEDSVIRCNICGEQFQTKRVLANHVKLHEEMLGEPSSSGNSDAKLTCTECPRKYSTYDELTQHQAKHNKHHYCHKCDLVFYNVLGFEGHIKKGYHKEKNARGQLVCDGCNRVYFKINEVRDHETKCLARLGKVVKQKEQIEVPEKMERMEEEKEIVEEAKEVEVSDDDDDDGPDDVEVVSSSDDDDGSDQESPVKKPEKLYCEACKVTFSHEYDYECHMDAGYHKNKDGFYTCTFCKRPFKTIATLTEHEKDTFP
ncbi:uncharacterized protein [Amphiura filiformis]|uniref:uncharacterized protein n=1 Tax=Amphiura filiformis TaxID=82378 RepID=UPI003B224511